LTTSRHLASHIQKAVIPFDQDGQTHVRYLKLLPMVQWKEGTDHRQAVLL